MPDTAFLQSLIPSLFSKELARLATSTYGMYGENRRSSLAALYDTLQTEFGMKDDSVFLDLGSGRGVPSLLLALMRPKIISLGMEIDASSFYLSLRQQLHFAKNIVQSREEANPPPLRIAFGKGDCTALDTFEPATHIYTFDVGMPADVMISFVEIANVTRTLTAFCCFRGDLVEEFGLDGTLAARLPMSMHGSNERHTCYLYRMNDKHQDHHHMPVQQGGGRSGLCEGPSVAQLAAFARQGEGEQISVLEGLVETWLAPAAVSRPLRRCRTTITSPSPPPAATQVTKNAERKQRRKTGTTVSGRGTSVGATERGGRATGRRGRAKATP
ncbi:unnamed protein product [Vitrella brassicaformis CCMP3155]|uniref:DOT1 domain-containing protein n=2 Tax=Vitrella brassicaformis TaxID=1169539 RepID=A0A0G4GJM7_VITBC|nr:unnamed protein product [Vitrella brassicaformis CCMP3155]|mmetsp:Transcript_8428/g.20640  ORF Transcript_8428/g.20640 Transcript_8428/m.20640 type:complete len:329 (+) Transcript_8428:89-1075(+)|eukprot:CEM30143.1 unnamed protein product [Vitrella brassicaformis CCMP3155]